MTLRPCSPVWRIRRCCKAGARHSLRTETTSPHRQLSGRARPARQYACYSPPLAECAFRYYQIDGILGPGHPRGGSTVPELERVWRRWHRRASQVSCAWPRWALAAYIIRGARGVVVRSIQAAQNEGAATSHQHPTRRNCTAPTGGLASRTRGHSFIATSIGPWWQTSTLSLTQKPQRPKWLTVVTSRPKSPLAIKYRGVGLSEE